MALPSSATADCGAAEPVPKRDVPPPKGTGSRNVAHTRPNPTIADVRPEAALIDSQNDRLIQFGGMRTGGAKPGIVRSLERGGCTMRILLALALLAAPMAASANMCPDGTFTSGECKMAPDGRYVNGKPKMAPDGTYVGGKPRMAPNGSYIGGGSGSTKMCPDGTYVVGRCKMTPDGKYTGD
jgi:hypothetical protein